MAIEASEVKRACSEDQLRALANSEGLRLRSGRFQCPARCSQDDRSCTARDGEDGALWYCHRCQKGGSIVDLLMLTRNLGVAEAIEAAAAALSFGIKPIPKPTVPARNASALWAKLAERDSAGERYLQGRSLWPNSWVKFNTGETGDEWLDRKARDGYRCGLTLESPDGRLVSIQFRTVVPGLKPSKLNLPGISTTETAFGDTRDARDADEVHLCEGFADTLAVKIATRGTVIGAPGADQLPHLVAFLGEPKGRTFKLWLQNDEKSRASFEILATALVAAGGRCERVQTPAPHKDPAERWEKERTLAQEQPRSTPPPALKVIEGGAAPKLAEEDPLANEPFTKDYSSLCRILRDPATREIIMGKPGALSFNEMTLMPCFAGQPINDADLSALRERGEVRFRGPHAKSGLKFSRQDVSDAVLQIASENPFHPVRSYLEGLRWDGKPRLDTSHLVHLNAKPERLTPVMMRRWYISAVARAMRPGCKVDTVLILVGPQGHRKSSFFRVLASDEWFADSAMVIGDKDSYLNLHSAWIYEWAELESMQRARDQGAVKAFISSPADRVRLPYGRTTKLYPRSCVIVGTTNEDNFLSDPTGSRRIWPVEVPDKLNLDHVERDRDQLWAEAVYAFRQNEPWYLTEDDDESDLTEVHEKFADVDAWETVIARFLKGLEDPSEVTVATIMERCLQLPVGAWKKSEQMKVAGILRRLGYKKATLTGYAGRYKAWVLPTPF